MNNSSRLNNNDYPVISNQTAQLASGNGKSHSDKFKPLVPVAFKDIEILVDKLSVIMQIILI